MPLDEKMFLQVIDDRIPEKIRKVNIEAFLKGKEAIKNLKT
jgi:hypothetical protein